MPVVLLAVAVMTGGAAKDATSPLEDDIRDLFQAKCVRCHGEKVRRAGLDLRTAAGALKGGESGPAVVPGKPDKSPLYEKVHNGAMPPAKADRLSEAEVERIRRWITGAGERPAASALTQHDVLPI